MSKVGSLARRPGWRALLLATLPAASALGLTHVFMSGVTERVLGPDISATLTPCGEMSAEARARTEASKAETGNTMYASYVAARKIELINYTDLALTSLRHLRDAGGDDADIQQRMKGILNGLNFGREDGYFYVYDLDTLTALVHPRLPGLVGKSLADVQAIRDLVDCARRGGGFHVYDWNRPSTARDELKLGYVVPLRLDGWSYPWMLGTGLYVDDLQRARREMHAGLERALLGVRLFAFAVVFAVVWATLSIQASRREVAREKQVRERILEAQEALRKDLAEDLHDGSIQVLVGIKLILEASCRYWTKRHEPLDAAPVRERDREALANLQMSLERLGTATTDLDRIAKRLVPVKLEELGLLRALESDVREFSADTGIAATLRISGDCAHLPPRLNLVVYRVGQEALRNIHRHANAKAIEVALARGAEHVELRVTDDGQGFDEADTKATRGLGLRNMRSRVESVGGRLSIHSGPGTTQVSAIIPL
jgi:two-component system, NarL family, sensor kinase